MQVSDEQLALDAFDGNEEAFADLYRRYYRGIYDFICRMVRDPDLVDDLVQSTFMKAWENLRKRRITGNVKAWLYTIARNNSLNELKRRRWIATPRQTEEGEDIPFPYAVADSSRLSDPQGVLEDKELADLVWRSAAALNHKEYALLDLHLRRGLNPEELAQAFGVGKRNMSVKLFRLRRSLEESVVTELLLRRGRDHCRELDALAQDVPADGLTLETRRAIVRHVDACPRCQDSRKRYASPVEMFTGLALVPVAAPLQSSTWQTISLRTGYAGGGGAAPARTRVRPLRWWSSATTTAKAAAVAAVTTAAGVPVAVVLVLASTGGGDTPATPPTSAGGPAGALGAVAEPAAPTTGRGLQLVDFAVRPPAAATAGEAFIVYAQADLLYSGPVETLLADTTFSLFAPADCAVDPSAPVTKEDTPLPQDTNVSVTRGFEVTCGSAGPHELRGEAAAAVAPTESATDPDSTDNQGSAVGATEVVP